MESDSVARRDGQISSHIEPRILFDVSLWTLLLANTLTIFVAYAASWNLFDIVVVYWAQSVIIGAFNVVRILSLRNFSTANMTMNGKPVPSSRAAQVYMAGFFAVHYGLFHFVYLVFLLSGIFGSSSASSIEAMLVTLGIPIAMFVGNHLFSYIQNHERDAARRSELGAIMFYPYVRIIPMHLTILIGAALVSLGAATWTLILFLTLKMFADIVMHVVEHRSK